MTAKVLSVAFFDLGDTLVSAGRAWLPGAQALLQHLRQPGLRLGILSNTTGMHSRADILALLPADFDLSLFEPELTLFSSEVGHAKPQKAIFLEAISRSGRPASECLYVSENMLETLMAQAAGMRSLRVQSAPNSDLAAVAGVLSDRASIPDRSPWKSQSLRDPQLALRAAVPAFLP